MGEERAIADSNNNHVHNEEAVSTPQRVPPPYIHPCDLALQSPQRVEHIHRDYYRGQGAQIEQIPRNAYQYHRAAYHRAKYQDARDGWAQLNFTTIQWCQNHGIDDAVDGIIYLLNEDEGR